MLYSFDFIYLHLIFNRSLKRSCPRVLMQSNCGYATRFAIVRSICAHPMSSDVTMKGCFYLLPRSVHFYFIEAKTRKHTETTRRQEAISPQSLRLRNHASFSCFLSICARLLELFACIAACINPLQDAFNDTDATRE